MADFDNEFDPYAGDFEFSGPGDTGCTHDDGPDSDDYEYQCSDCGEPCSMAKMSKITPSVCLCCCPVRKAERELEIFEDLK